METTLGGILVRIGQTAIESSSTAVIGLFVAAILRRMVGAAGTRRLFGDDGWQGLFRGWAIGSLLPVCGLGVIPVVRELRRAGVPAATVLAFLLAAPQLNPLSFLYGLTLSEPVVIVAFVLATMAIAVLGGELWKLLFDRPDDMPAGGDEPPPAKGLPRLASVLVSAARDATGPTMGYILFGIVVTGLIAGCLPYGCLSESMKAGDPASPLLMAALGLFAYSGVLPGMMRIGLMFDHGNSSGAAFVLFEIGIGMNAALIAWLAVTYGPRRAAGWLALILAMTLGIAYAMERPLYFATHVDAHTHAFDDWSNPWPEGMTPHAAAARDKLLQKVEILEPLALATLGLLLPLGWLVRRVDRGGAVESWITRPRPVPPGGPSIWNHDVPGPVLGAVALVGLVVLSVVGLFIYYPSVPECLDMMTRTRADAFVAVNTGRKEEAIRQLERLDLITRKMQVGAFLRTGAIDAAGGKAAEELRDQLEAIRDAFLANDPAAARRLLPDAEKAYRACRKAFQPETTPDP
jgi:uncharacterized membrane protein YraQ (UPF0718 family)